MSSNRKLAATGLVAVAAVLLGSCGGNDEPTEPTASASPTQSDTPSEPVAGTGEVDTAESDLGTILVDEAGLTLYMFTNDTQGEPSVCEGDCLAAWPALEGEPAAGEGVEDGLLGSSTRGDGMAQATYDGWPLYYFAQDAAPGDVNGQGVGGVWFVLAPDGTVVREAPPGAGE